MLFKSVSLRVLTVFFMIALGSLFDVFPGEERIFSLSQIFWPSIGKMQKLLKKVSPMSYGEVSLLLVVHTLLITLAGFRSQLLLVQV